MNDRPVQLFAEIALNLPIDGLYSEQMVAWPELSRALQMVSFESWKLCSQKQLTPLRWAIHHSIRVNKPRENWGREASHLC